MALDPASPSVLRRLLEAAGYRLEERSVGLRAVRLGDRRAVLVVDGPRSPAELEAEFPADAIHRTIVYPQEPGAVARALASERGLEILDPDSLGPALGELLLAGGAAGSRGDEEGPTMVAPSSALPESERTVRPRLDRRDAERLAGVDGFRYTLRLVPYYVAAYRVRTVSPHGEAGRMSDHLAAINALSGRVEVWEPQDREFVAEVEIPHQRLEPRLSDRQALEAADPVVRRRHTVSVDHTEQHGGALVIERRKVPPGPSDLAFGAPVLVHVPFWYVEGAEGRVVLDAVTGTRAVADTPDLEHAR